MFRRLLTLGLVCILCLTVFTTCSKKTTEPNEDDPIPPIVSSQVVVLNPAMIPYFEFAEDHILFPDIPGVTLPTLNVGVILVSPPCPEAPNGFLRKITGVKKLAASTEVSTEESALDEVFDQGDIESGEQDLETTRIKSSRALCDGVTFENDAKDTTKFTYNLNMNLTRQGINLNLQGPISFSQKFGFKTKIAWLKTIKKIDFTSHTVQSLNLTATLSPTALNQTAEWDTTLYEHEMEPYTFWIGVVPVVIVPVISVDLYVTAEGNAYITAGVTQSQTIDAGLHYNKSSSPKWSTSWTRQKTHSFTGPEVTLNGTVESGIGPKLTCYLYGLVGPSAGAYGFLQLDVTPLDVPWWKLSLGGKLQFEIDLKKISKNMQNPSMEVKSELIPIAQSDPNQCVTPAFSLLPGIYHTTPLSIGITCSTSGATVRYTTDGSEPSSTSQICTSPLSIPETTTLKAKAFKDNWTSSPTATGEFEILILNVVSPVLTPNGGLYNNPQTVSMSCPTSGATIRYTIDGTEPTPASNAYTAPINVASTAIVKARAFKSGWNPSPVISNSYLIGSMADTFIAVTGGTYNNGMSILPNVTVSGFKIDKNEITQAKYQAVMSANPSLNGGNPSYPVEKVSWFNAIEFCNRLSLLENLTPCYTYSGSGTNPANWPSGWNTSATNHSNLSCNWSANGYRLPTEAEWHFAARGGISSQGYLFSGGNTLDNVAWNLLNSGFPPSTHTVGLKTANELGLYDMSGNVWEWVWDIYGNYPGGAASNPHGATGGTYRVLRGASVICHSGYFPLLHRNYLNANYNFMDVGFRICKNN